MLLSYKNKCQLSANDFRPCILEYLGPVWLHWSIIEQMAALQAENDSNKIAPLSQNHCQHSLNDFWSIILANLMAKEHRYPTMNISAAFVGENTSDNIVFAYYNWLPTLCQQFWLRLRTLHCNEMNFAVTNQVLHCQFLQSLPVYNFPYMHTMSYRSDLFACSCWVNI
jgi:hypothetical protein